MIDGPLQKTEICQSFYALPPSAQRIREMRALLTDLSLWSLLGPNQTIQKIEKTENGYRVAADSFSLEVKILYKQDGRRIGPADFEFVFSELETFSQPSHGQELTAEQTLQELQALLADPCLYEILGSVQLIEKIEKTENGYFIQTNRDSIAVRIIEAQGHSDLPQFDFFS
jgi:hypothetical protein